MSKDKKPVIEKRYAIPSKDSIRVIGESVGYELDEECLSLLCEDVSYRLRQIVQSSSKFMRHERRRRLTVEDVNHALKSADVQAVYGQGSGEPAHFQLRDSDLYITPDPELNLVDIALSDEQVVDPGQTSVKAHWLAVEGVHRATAQRPTVTERKPVSDDLLVYYDQMAKSILSADDDLRRTALLDLKTNPKVLPVVAYFINFVSNGVSKVNRDLSVLMRLLQTVQALIINGSLFLEPRPYLNSLTQSVLYCVVDPLTSAGHSVHDVWRLRDYAARLLAQITHRWNNVVNQLLFKTAHALREVFCSEDKPACSRYGAVVALGALGTATVDQVLLPHLSGYFTKRANSKWRMDYDRLDGAVLNVCLRVLSDDVDDAARHERMRNLYSVLYDYYGESVSCRLTQLHPWMCCLNGRPREDVRLYEPLRSGEEMLAEFMDMVKKDQRTNEDAKSELTDRSENNEDSPTSFKSDRTDRSDYEEPSAPGVHLTVKSTVNDPNLGIKLTITKRPGKEDGKKRLKKRRIRYKAQDVFEKVNYERYHPFVFNVPRLVKWNSKATYKDFTLDYVSSRESHEFRRLFLTHPPFWNAKKRIKKKPVLLVNSGSMFCTF